MHRVLVVGAGATGASACWRLRQLLPEMQLEVWEKARGPGGRMSTTRTDAGRADMGAQYVSLEEDALSAQVRELLLSSGVCCEVPPERLAWTPERQENAKHLAGVEGGVNDALKLLLKEARAELRYELRAESVSKIRELWRVDAFQQTVSGLFDAVLIAVPGCGVGGDNLDKIHGNWEGMLTAEQNTQLLAVEHDQRWSFAFFLPPGCKSACESYFGDAVEKLVDDDVVHLLCYQSRKTAMLGKAQSESPAVVAHTTQDWAKRHEKRGGRDERLLREVAAHVQKLLRVEGALTQLTDTSKVITWKQCQVTEPVASETPCMVVSREPPLLLAGDYFAESSFSGCLQSGVAAAEALSKLLGPPKAVHVEGKGSGGCGGKDKGKGKKGKDYSDDSDGPRRKGEFIGKKGEYGKGKGKGKKGKDYSDDSDGPGRKGEFIGKKGEYGITWWEGGKKGKDCSDDSDGPGRKGEFIGKKGEYGITWGDP